VKFLVTGGYFDDSGECVVFQVDVSTGEVREWLRFQPPEHLRVPTKGFSGGTVTADGSYLYVAAHSFVARIDIQRARIDGLLHQPCFNDLHHVAVDPSGGHLWIANTGLGSVDILDVDGGFVGSHALLPAWVNARRMGGATPPWESALRPGWSGKPPASWPSAPLTADGYHTSEEAFSRLPFHQTKVRDHLHPNHVGFLGDRALVTCLYDGSVRDLGNFSIVARLDGEFPHDGQAIEDLYWVTTIDGQVVCLDLAREPGVLVERWDVSSTTGRYGWCRGLHVRDEHLFVGMTEVRDGRLPKHRWSERSPACSETSVICIERGTGHLLARVEMTDRQRHLKIYSLIELESA
jgi:hypothetical protein